MKRLRITKFAAIAVVVGLAVPSAALAVTHWTGTNGPNTKTGGTGADLLEGLGGKDTLNGGAGHDFLLGGPGADTINGGAGHDTIQVNAGRDKAYGGPGADTLWAIGSSDVTTPGSDMLGDTLNGGAGDDVFHTNDGESDTVVCGPGVNDVVYGDIGLDVIAADCEHVFP